MSDIVFFVPHDGCGLRGGEARVLLLQPIRPGPGRLGLAVGFRLPRRRRRDPGQPLSLLGRQLLERRPLSDIAFLVPHDGCGLRGGEARVLLLQPIRPGPGRLGLAVGFRLPRRRRRDPGQPLSLLGRQLLERRPLSDIAFLVPHDGCGLRGGEARVLLLQPIRPGPGRLGLAVGFRLPRRRRRDPGQIGFLVRLIVFVSSGLPPEPDLKRRAIGDDVSNLQGSRLRRLAVHQPRRQLARGRQHRDTAVIAVGLLRYLAVPVLVLHPSLPASWPARVICLRPWRVSL